MNANPALHNAYAQPAPKVLSSARIILYPLAAIISVGISVVCLYFASTTSHVGVHVVIIILAICVLFAATWFLKSTLEYIESFNDAHKRLSYAPPVMAPAQYGMGPWGMPEEKTSELSDL